MLASNAILSRKAIVAVLEEAFWWILSESVTAAARCEWNWREQLKRAIWTPHTTHAPPPLLLPPPPPNSLCLYYYLLRTLKWAVWWRCAVACCCCSWLRSFGRNETAVTFWPNWPWTDSSDSFHDRGHDGNLGNFAGRWMAFDPNIVLMPILKPDGEKTSPPHFSGWIWAKNQF